MEWNYFGTPTYYRECVCRDSWMQIGWSALHKRVADTGMDLTIHEFLQLVRLKRASQLR